LSYVRDNINENKEVEENKAIIEYLVQHKDRTKSYHFRPFLVNTNNSFFFFIWNKISFINIYILLYFIYNNCTVVVFYIIIIYINMNYYIILYYIKSYIHNESFFIYTVYVI